MGAANLIPGPSSTEMAIFISYLCKGWAGLLLGGLCFIIPAMVTAYGLYALSRTEYDVFPEFAAPQVAIHTEAPGLVLRSCNDLELVVILE